VPDFEDEDELVATGVTPILRYDPLGRLTRTDLPDGSYTRSTFDAWTQMAWDPNDTSGEAGNLWTAARLPGATPTPSAEEQRAAELALEHADTPATSHIDALGRVFLVQARLTALGATPPKIVETPHRDGHRRPGARRARRASSRAFEMRGEAGGVPEVDGAILGRGREQGAVGGEGNPPRPLGVPLQSRDAAARVDVP